MNMRRAGAVVAALFASLVVTTASSQPASGKPTIVVGDRWEFTRNLSPNKLTETTTLTVVEVLGDDRLRIKTTVGSLVEFDGAMDWMPEGNPDRRFQLATFPLALGKEWAVGRRQFATPDYSETGKARVAAIETVTVPAGTFQCWRIDAEALLVGKYRPPNKDVKVDPARPDYTEARTWRRWYCPQVKWIAKQVLETRYYHPNSPQASNTTVETQELVRFTPGK